MAKYDNSPNVKNFTRKNEQIRVPRILLIKDGVNRGEVNTSEALAMARDAGLDLVEVAPQNKPPVCSILDFGKYKFEQAKKEKDRQRNSGPKEKEVAFRYVIDDNDLQTKINQVKKFLEHGDKVKIVVKFKQRENAHRDQGLALVKKCAEQLAEFATIEKPPGFEGNTVTCRLMQKAK
jgi:translation initiation factor IF-3